MVIANEGWQLIGDLTLPATIPAGGAPAVLLLNGAGRNRSAYTGIASTLAGLGIASLRLDLRGMGESTNRGRFIPFDSSGHNERIGFDRSWSDVAAALDWLAARRGVNGARIGVIGASYSGEALAQAMRARPSAAPPVAVAALSPGSFSDSSLARIDGDGRPWLFAYSSREITVREWRMDQWTRRGSRRAHVIVTRDSAHATDLLRAPEMEQRLAEWFTRALRVEPASDRFARAADRVAASLDSVPDDLRAPGAVTASLGDGVAGRLHFLSAWHLARQTRESRARAMRTARQLIALTRATDTVPPPPNAAPFALYGGAAGVAFALLEGAEALGDSSLRQAGRVMLQRIHAGASVSGDSVRWSGADDVLTGNAGTVAALFHAWRILDDTAARTLAQRGASTLARRGVTTDSGRFWRWRDGAPWNLPNFSHGTAGVATVLALVSRDPTAPATLLPAAREGARYLIAVARRDARGMRIPYGWPLPEGGWERPFDVSWAHGQAGTVRLFRELWLATLDTLYLAVMDSLVSALDSTVDVGTSRPRAGEGAWEFDYRFGIAGIADLYADLYDATGRRHYLARAVALADYLLEAADGDARALWTRPRRAFMPQAGEPATFTGLLHGAAGPGLLFLKLDALLHGRRPPPAVPDSPFPAAR